MSISVIACIDEIYPLRKIEIKQLLSVSILGPRTGPRGQKGRLEVAKSSQACACGFWLVATKPQTSLALQ